MADKAVHCSRCPAACCRWEVPLSFEESVIIPEDLQDLNENGEIVMARRSTLYCKALDLGTFRCTIESIKPLACRDFQMGGRSCLEARAQMSPHQLRQTQ